MSVIQMINTSPWSYAPRYYVPYDALDSLEKWYEYVSTDTSLKDEFGWTERDQIILRYSVTRTIEIGSTRWNHKILTGLETVSWKTWYDKVYLDGKELGGLPLRVIPQSVWTFQNQKPGTYAWLLSYQRDLYVAYISNQQGTKTTGYLRVSNGYTKYGATSLSLIQIISTMKFGTNTVSSLRDATISDPVDVDLRPMIPNVIELCSDDVNNDDARINAKLITGIANNSQAVDLNGLTVFTDLRELFSLFSSPINTLSSALKSLDKPLKALASGYLQYKYVYTTTKLDVEDVLHASAEFQELTQARAVQNKVRSIKEGLSDLSFRYANAKTSALSEFVSHDWNVATQSYMTCYYDTYDQALLPIIRALQTSGFFIDFTNIWDIVPFSFVVDWFYPIQDITEMLDAPTYISNLPVRALYKTRRIRYFKDTLVTPNWTVNNIELITYKRERLDGFPPFRPFLPDAQFKWNHFAEGTALLIQIKG